MGNVLLKYGEWVYEGSGMREWSVEMSVLRYGQCKYVCMDMELENLI